MCAGDASSHTSPGGHGCPAADGNARSYIDTGSHRYADACDSYAFGHQHARSDCYSGADIHANSDCDTATDIDSGPYASTGRRGGT